MVRVQSDPIRRERVRVARHIFVLTPRNAVYADFSRVREKSFFLIRVRTQLIKAHALRRSLSKVSYLRMVTHSKSHVYTPDISLLLYGFVRQEIVHHTRTHSGRIKGNESPSLFPFCLCPSLSLDSWLSLTSF